MLQVATGATQPLAWTSVGLAPAGVFGTYPGADVGLACCRAFANKSGLTSGIALLRMCCHYMPYVMVHACELWTHYIEIIHVCFHDMGIGAMHCQKHVLTAHGIFYSQNFRWSNQCWFCICWNTWQLCWGCGGLACTAHICTWGHSLLDHINVVTMLSRRQIID